jgi:putative phosphoesterase
MKLGREERFKRGFEIKMQKETKKLAVLSDIHSNHYALKACIDWIYNHDIDGVLFLGDYISDCPYPQKTIQLISEVMKNYQTWFVVGNREEIMVDKSKDKFDWNCHQESLKYTYENLTKEDIIFFRSLPLTEIVKIEGYPVISMAHGDLHGTKNKLLPDSEQMKRILTEMVGSLHICGHTHMPFIYEAGGKTVLNPGSVGVPVSGYAKAEMAIIESNGDKWRPTLFRLEYDVKETIEEFYESGLASCAGVWVRCIIALLQSGRHYCEECLNLISIYAKETGKDFNDPELWERAATQLGI